MIATVAPLYSPFSVRRASELGLPFEEVSFSTQDGLVLRGWFFPAEQVESPAVLYAPATSHDQLSGLSLARPLHDAGYHVLLFSYRGHGESDGDPLGFTYGASESLDIDAAVQYLYDERGIHRIGAIGHSAGAVAIILSAARNPRLGAVVAASPFTSVDEIWETNRPAFFPKPLYQAVFKLVERRKGFLREQVRAEQSIGRIAPHPLLIIHGSEDRRITREQALRLFRLARPPKQMWVIQGADHRSVRDPGLDALIGQIILFLNQALKEPPATQFTGR